MSEALRLAELLTNLKITVKGRDNAEAMEEAAAELRRLHAEHTELGQAINRAIERNNELEAEIAEQARLVGMGGEREARLMALNAELVEALRKCDEAMTWELGGEPLDTLMTDARNAARAALAKTGDSK